MGRLIGNDCRPVKSGFALLSNIYKLLSLASAAAAAAAAARRAQPSITRHSGQMWLISLSCRCCKRQTRST